jgi:hypothetical protein
VVVHLVACPQCDESVLVAKEDVREVRCGNCRRFFDPRRAETRDDPTELRRQVMRPLNEPVRAVQGIAAFQAAGGPIVGLYLPAESAVFVGPLDWFTGFLYTFTGLFLFIGGIVAFFGARLILRGQWGIGVAAAWLVIANPLVIGIPIGIWMLRELYRPGVRQVFASRPAE